MVITPRMRLRSNRRVAPAVTVHSLDLTRAGLIAALAPAAPDGGIRPSPTAPVGNVGEPRRRLQEAIDLYGNEDALARRYALAACDDGSPAFWTTAAYHSQKACVLQLAVHRQPTLEAAVAYAYGPQPGTDVLLAAFDTLIPLNMSAVKTLARAYAGLGQCHGVGELESRSMCKPQTRGQPCAPLECPRREDAGLDEQAAAAFSAAVIGDSAAGQTRGKS